jgi:L-ribulokinase
MANKKLVIGVDYGTDSVRSILVDSADGNEIASSVFNYPRWNKGLYCDAAINQFRQHPLDYIEGLEFTVKEILKADPNASQEVAAISIDTTGSTGKIGHIDHPRSFLRDHFDRFFQ